MRGGKVLKRKDISSSRIMVMEDGREFYPAKYRMDDFKKEHPTGRFSTEAIEFKANSMAVFKAYVYPDSDPDSRPLSEAYCMRWYDMNTVNFVETAETGAISRALANAGYNLCSYELNEGIDPLSRMIDLDGNPYLNVMWRLAWIRRDTDDCGRRTQIWCCAAGSSGSKREKRDSYFTNECHTYSKDNGEDNIQ